MSGIDVENEAGFGLRAEQGIAPVAPPTPTDGGEAIFGAAFRQSNSVVSAIQYMRNSGRFAPQPDYNPLTDIKKWDKPSYFLEHGDKFIGSQSPAETQSIKGQIDTEETDKRTLSANGKIGFVAQTMAGSLDPTMLLPGGVAIDAAKGGLAFTKAAVAVGKAGFMQTVAQEALLHGSQDTRTFTESALNVASGTLLTALIGGGAASLLSPVERAALETRLHADRAAINEHAGNPSTGETPPQMPSGTQGEAAAPVAANVNEPAGTGLAAAAGAAASDTRKIELVPFGLNQMPGVRTVVEKTSPMQRLFGAESVTVRRTAADLAETSLLTKENLEGKVTTAGPALDREARLNIHQSQVAVGDELSRLFSEYRFGEQKVAPRTRALFEDATGRAPEGKMSFDQFKEAVSDAGRNGDLHDIPQVQMAAQFIRNRVFEPWKKRAIDAGLLPEDVSTKTADSYVSRLYNKQAIAAKRPDFVNRVTDWLVGDQKAKAESQEKIGLYQGALESHRTTIDKLNNQIDARNNALQNLETRQEEIQRLNKFAFQRSTKMSEPLDQMRAKIRTIEARIAPELEKLNGLAENIKTEKDLFPEVRQSDSLIFKMIGAGQKLRESRELIDTVDAATEYLAHLDDVISGFKGGVREAAKAAKQIREDLGAHELIALEKERTALNKEIKPFQKELRKTRKELREERESKIQNAQGGSVFETQIRQRGNTLADRASGKSSELSALEDKLTLEIQNRDLMREKLEKEIAAWEGKSTGEAKAALKARTEAEKAREAAKVAGTYEGKDERLSSADKAVDKAVKRILKSDRDLSRAELQSRANDITDRIIGSPDGRLPYDLGMEHGTAFGGSGEQPRGALAAREFNIPDATIRDFLENDAEHIVAAHLRTMVPDVLLTEKFGDTRMTEAFRKINDEYAALSAAAKSDAARTKLEKERLGAIDDLSAIRDRIRGIYGISPDGPMRNAARAMNVLKNYNVLTSMGSAALSSLPDMAGSVMRYGLTTTFNDAWSPFFSMLTRQSDVWQEAGRQYRAMGIAVESVLASRHHALMDTLDTYHPQSRVERTMQWATGKFQFINLLAPWTDFAKINASMVAGSEILRAVKAENPSARQLRNLGESGIEPHMAARIAKAFEDGGEIRDGVHLPNTADWTDKEARRVFEGAVARDADIAVVTPGQEKPLWMSHPLLSVIGQFKSFTAAATERILISNLQRRDAQVLQGMIFSLGLGMLSYKINSLTGGQPVSDKPQDWIKEAISKANLLGWAEEANAMASKATRGGVDVYRMIGADKPLSRYASRSAMDQLLGPTAGKIGGILGTVSAASKPSEWSEADSKALRRLVAGQNVFYIRRLFDQVEQSGNNAFGIEMKAKPENR